MVDSLEGIPDVEPSAKERQVAAPDNDFDGLGVGKGEALDLGSSVAIRVGSSPTTAPPKHTWMLFYENPDEPALVAESSD